MLYFVSLLAVLGGIGTIWLLICYENKKLELASAREELLARRASMERLGIGVSPITEEHAKVAGEHHDFLLDTLRART
jgi:predicted thioredoxin/glutaredoxin